MQAYDERFYEGQVAGSRSSAAIITPVLLEMIAPKSVLDVGCGTGAWLAEFQSHGISDVLGVDGHSAERAMLIPNQHFRRHDLTQPLQLPRRFDLAICLEVAEHLPSGSADVLVDSLTEHAEVILFSAAAPGQGGTQHVNEQWPSYWIPKFEQNNFQILDVLRPVLWRQTQIEPWYLQNLLLVVKQGSGIIDKLSSLPSLHGLDVAHPKMVALMTAPTPLPERIRAAVKRIVSR